LTTRAFSGDTLGKIQRYLGFWIVSLLMDISSKMIHNQRALFMVTTLGIRVLAVGIINAFFRPV
jgi:hypothetical protein